MRDWRIDFDASIELCDSGRYFEAIELLSSLLRAGIEKSSDRAAISGQIGGIYLFDLNQPVDAEMHFRNAMELAPSSELASLGLFHSLMDQRKVLEALDEMKRFVTSHSSDEYSKVMDEIAQAVDSRVSKLRR